VPEFPVAGVSGSVGSEDGLLDEVVDMPIDTCQVKNKGTEHYHQLVPIRTVENQTESAAIFLGPRTDDMTLFESLKFGLSPAFRRNVGVFRQKPVLRTPVYHGL
jgi:hypothetical protein